MIMTIGKLKRKPYVHRRLRAISEKLIIVKIADDYTHQRPFLFEMLIFGVKMHLNTIKYGVPVSSRF